jgi:adenylate kinase family enzyme
LETFYSETMPVIQAFESGWKVITIDADRSIEEIYEDMHSKLILN